MPVMAFTQAVVACGEHFRTRHVRGPAHTSRSYEPTRRKKMQARDPAIGVRGEADEHHASHRSGPAALAVKPPSHAVERRTLLPQCNPRDVVDHTHADLVGAPAWRSISCLSGRMVQRLRLDGVVDVEACVGLGCLGGASEGVAEGDTGGDGEGGAGGEVVEDITGGDGDVVVEVGRDLDDSEAVCGGNELGDERRAGGEGEELQGGVAVEREDRDAELRLRSGRGRRGDVEEARGVDPRGVRQRRDFAHGRAAEVAGRREVVLCAVAALPADNLGLRRGGNRRRGRLRRRRGRFRRCRGRLRRDRAAWTRRDVRVAELAEAALGVGGAVELVGGLVGDDAREGPVGVADAAAAGDGDGDAVVGDGEGDG
mmetsp:Transcript_21754/g.58094  ORF Transcript_21754/g.58094 Transcript_21754/m.58094 type:complete len:370 (-) Transcript_21754:382-1491(-)